jgi:hypothetical protein
VDKTRILEELMPLIREGKNYLCVTRPRRFGKTVMANMIAAYFGKGIDSRSLFDDLTVAQNEAYLEFLNQYNLIFIDFSKISSACNSYEMYISEIETSVIDDLQEVFPECVSQRRRGLAWVLERIRMKTGEKFIFVLDEWDAVFHMHFQDTDAQRKYLLFLKELFKDQAYVALVYMTGILPIAKYSSGSDLNMFSEYTMINQTNYIEYFGFTQSEVDTLLKQYGEIEKQPIITNEELQSWYNGYYTAAGERIFNPRSVVSALRNNQLANYWTSSGPNDEIFYYVKHNVAEVRDDLALMVAGEAVPAKIDEYAATAKMLETKDEIFSAMLVYGFLTYVEGKVSIPNRELMAKFEDMLRKESSLGYVYRLAKESERMLQATIAGDVKTMSEILEYVHDTETPLLSYNHEVELSAIVNLAYLSARNQYDVRREQKSGKGFVDFVFYPYRKGDDGIILELKVNHSPEEAIAQIKEKKYALVFGNKMGTDPVNGHMGRILAVGIGYDKNTKEHSCKVEVIWEGMA